MGTDTIQNCISCDTCRGYYPYNPGTPQCVNINDIGINAFINYNVTSGSDPMIELCNSNCSTCSKGGDAIHSNYLTCNTVNNYYPLEDDLTQCYSRNEIIFSYAFDSVNHIFKKCITGCDVCEYPFDNITHNCIKCNSEYESYYFPLLNQYNCYPKRSSASILYYIDRNDNNKYIQLSSNDNCPSAYPFLFKLTGECISSCSGIVQGNKTYIAQNYYMHLSLCYINGCPEYTISIPNTNLCQGAYPYTLLDKQYVTTSQGMITIALYNMILPIVTNEDIEIVFESANSIERGYLYTSSVEKYEYYKKYKLTTTINYQATGSGIDRIIYYILKNNVIVAIRAKIDIIICEEGCECSSSDDFCVDCLINYNKLISRSSLFKCVDECKGDYAYHVMTDDNKKECYYSCDDNSYGKKKMYGFECLLQCPSNTNDVNDYCIEKSLTVSGVIATTSQSKIEMYNSLSRNLNSYYGIKKGDITIKGSDYYLQLYKMMISPMSIYRNVLIY